MGLLKNRFTSSKKNTDQYSMMDKLTKKHPNASKARLQSFDKQVSTGGLNKSCQRILGLYKEHGPLSIQQLSERFHIPINIVSGRTSDLKKGGYIEVAGKVFNQETHYHNTTYRAVL